MSTADWRAKAVPASYQAQRSTGEKRRARAYVAAPPPPGERYGWEEASNGLLRLTLPLPPTKNDITGARAVVMQGKPRAMIYETGLAKEYKALVAELLVGCPKCEKPTQLAASWLVVHARAGGDLLNRMEAGFDALEGIAYDDDSQIAEVTSAKREVGDWPRWVLYLRPSRFDAYGQEAA